MLVSVLDRSEGSPRLKSELVSTSDASVLWSFTVEPTQASTDEERILNLARAVAGRLLARGLKPGDRVAVVAETDADFPRVLMGCLYARLVPCPVPLPSAFGSRLAYGEQLRRIANVAGISAAVAPRMFSEWIAESLSEMGLAFVGSLDDLDNATPPCAEAEDATSGG